MSRRGAVASPLFARAALLLAVASVASPVGGGCGAPPWRLGRPLDGRPSIPPDTGRPAHEQWRAAARRARDERRPVLEVQALLALEDAMRIDDRETSRLAELLVARAEAFRGAGRAIPESRDLETAARLDPRRGRPLVGARASAAAAAGDAWKAIGAADEARSAYNLATRLGGASAAVDRPRSPSIPVPAPGLPEGTDLDSWLFGGAVLGLRLLPLVEAVPGVLDDRERALRWAEILLAEDPTSPDALELVALIFGRAGRFGGTERMLVELAFHSPDRAAGLARGAVVWERLGRGREACAAWIRAARWRDDAEDLGWRKAITCSRKDPGAGDWRAIRDYVVARAVPERREAIASELEALLAEGAGPSPPATGDAGAPDGRSPADAGAGGPG